MIVPQPFLSPVCKLGPYPLDLIATAACLNFGHRVSHHLRLGFLLRSCFKKLAPVFRLEDKWCQRCLQLKGLNYHQLSSDGLTSTCSTSFSFFNGGKGRPEARFGNAGSKMSAKNPFNGRKWTNILLAANVLCIYSVMIGSAADRAKVRELYEEAPASGFLLVASQDIEKELGLTRENMVHRSFHAPNLIEIMKHLNLASLFLFTCVQTWSILHLAVVFQCRKMEKTQLQGHILTSLINLVSCSSCYLPSTNEVLNCLFDRGYSSLAIALVLPESGRLVACERDAKSLDVAKKYYQLAGVSHKVPIGDGMTICRKR